MLRISKFRVTDQIYELAASCNTMTKNILQSYDDDLKTYYFIFSWWVTILIDTDKSEEGHWLKVFCL